MLISFDVTNLFQNIPLIGIKNIIDNIISIIIEAN